jgi:hypothetical protein
VKENEESELSSWCKYTILRLEMKSIWVILDASKLVKANLLQFS